MRVLFFLMWNQFLSMKLTAASSYYDFNSEADAVDSMQVHNLEFLPNKYFLTMNRLLIMF